MVRFHRYLEILLAANTRFDPCRKPFKKEGIGLKYFTQAKEHAAKKRLLSNWLSQEIKLGLFAIKLLKSYLYREANVLH